MENFLNISQRQLRVGERVRQIISDCFLKEIILEPSLTQTSITVSKVKMSKDLKIAYVYLMPLNKSNIEKIKKILDLNKFVFQKELGKKIKTKFTPKIIFHIDDSHFEKLNIVNFENFYFDPRDHIYFYCFHDNFST